MYKVLSITAIVSLVYISFAYITLELNPLVWSESTRFLFVIANVLCTVSIICWYYLVLWGDTPERIK